MEVNYRSSQILSKITLEEYLSTIRDLLNDTMNMKIDDSHFHMGDKTLEEMILA